MIPDELIELGVNSDIWCFHHLGYEASNFSKSFGSFLLELSSVCEFVNVNGMIDSNFRESLSLLFFTHFNHEIIIIKIFIFSYFIRSTNTYLILAIIFLRLLSTFIQFLSSQFYRSLYMFYQYKLFIQCVVKYWWNG